MGKEGTSEAGDDGGNGGASMSWKDPVAGAFDLRTDAEVARSEEGFATRGGRQTAKRIVLESTDGLPEGPTETLLLDHRKFEDAARDTRDRAGDKRGSEFLTKSYFGAEFLESATK